jgi:hypothetical protein
MSLPALDPDSQSARFDERWAAWQAKGAAHDRTFRRKMAVAVPLAIVIALVAYALLVG